jgi:hypothetical protein
MSLNLAAALDDAASIVAGLGSAQRPRMRPIASARVRPSVLKTPRTAAVTVTLPGFRMPRIATHRCSACTTTITPAASSRSCTASATCEVNRYCTCGRLAYRSMSRASLDKPVIRPLGPGM